MSQKGLRFIFVAPYVRESDERLRLIEYINFHKIAKQSVFIGNPLPNTIRAKTVIRVWLEGQLKQERFISRKHNDSTSWLVDVFITLAYSLKFRTRFEYYVGAGTWFQASLGLLLKKLGIVRTVVFWTTDYMARRSTVDAISRLYQSLDRFCAEHSDICWSPTESLVAARIRSNYELNSRKQILIPYTVPFSSTWTPQNSQTFIPNSIIYMGAFMGGRHGFDLLLESVASLVRKGCRTLKVIVLSYERTPTKYLTSIDALGLDSYFQFLGFVEKDSKVNEIISKGMVGLALYEPGFKTFDDPARPKHFLANGVPVIISRSVPFAKMVEAANAGFAISYNSEELTGALLSIFEGRLAYGALRDNAARLGLQLDSDNVFSNVLSLSGICAAGS